MKASKTLIGAFVVGAVVLATAAVLVFGGGRFFEQRTEYVLYFDSSVAGLNPGAPVLLSGVKVGAVKDISIQFNVSDYTFRTPVIVEIYNNFVIVGEDAVVREMRDRLGSDRNRLRQEITSRLVERGLRAQLKLQSFVTGQLAVELVFRPQSPVHLMGDGGPRLELPTIRSEIEEVMRTIEDLPIREIAKDFQAIVTRVNEILSSPEAKETTVSVAELTKSLSSIARTLDQKSGGIADGARDLIARLDDLARKIGDQFEPLAGNIDESTKELQETLAQARLTLDTLEKSVRGDSALVRDARSALRSLTEALDALRALADYLQRHPEALLRGKKED